jgi:hypothetical protein
MIIENINKLLVIGCNYHTKWQSHPAMRFILKEIKGDKVILFTRRTKKEFKTNIEDLIFINSSHNLYKAKKFLGENIFIKKI